MAIRMESRARGPRPKPLDAAPTAFKCRAIPLMELRHGECRWPLNEPERGGLYLFCGLHADGSYCETHRLISLGSGTNSERRAVRELERAA